jgi:hypothetical protein
LSSGTRDDLYLQASSVIDLACLLAEWRAHVTIAYFNLSEYNPPPFLFIIRL